ncbi:MAG: hypothetical protein COV55_04365 [Candidatus Komeilibacteria bacterium CG11_big_fil_rev_8_21_14_0_20_36_20]|uniref:Uncharacterized protein n=1 Tax=Candidatus Komeilibacteria bacterium CG11_big_fil_rev_8_21_14_0_20_36_20 TaxID=1974477 RepID=A0A2H0NDV0_9BACT|nr:MAG: hypothetical protein COV55_04365 [Candidatus Komeilibacteria bacterium CG11_big_fil_rev_8_21_14_0_20_36_20]PIR81477.1 MAG: hypothetical protein COU21_03595 [Candidatus Komeilibacteria bacterium CG10_big_fil_rev_8_21_14_0_10_36_65]PJC55678.1 MAG: hypothetical protein CO027_00950 [Candidatus Komeilibacteria bacterium CG_4_9_14_0_2_um_filter_36_13]
MQKKERECLITFSAVILINIVLFIVFQDQLPRWYNELKNNLSKDILLIMTYSGAFIGFVYYFLSRMDVKIKFTFHVGTFLGSMSVIGLWFIQGAPVGTLIIYEFCCLFSYSLVFYGLSGIIKNNSMILVLE